MTEICQNKPDLIANIVCKDIATKRGPKNIYVNRVLCLIV